MLRILLFLGTNLAVVFLAGLIFQLLGLEGFLKQNGVGIDYWSLLIYAAVFGFLGSFVSLLLSKTMAKMGMGVQVIETPRDATERWLVETVARQAKAAGIAMPEVGVFDHPSPNAFATGWNKDAALVAVSTGLLHNMRQDEVEAVLGHEVSHVANGDMVTLALIQGVVNTFVIFLSRIVGFVVDRALSRGDNRGGGTGPAFFIVSMIAQVVLGIFATMIVMWFSRWREFRADAGGARLAGRQSMIDALKRLQALHETPPLPDEMAAFAFNAGKVQALFASHPPLEDRIAALESAAGETGGAPAGRPVAKDGPWSRRKGPWA